jgi:hypothetical protein
MSTLPRAESAASHSAACAGDDSDSSGPRSQALCRTLNEQIRRIADSFAVEEELELVCECEREHCFAPLLVSAVEYEAVRHSPARFLIRVGHDGPAERIVYESARYAVVEKIGHSAKDSDSRRIAAGSESREPIAALGGQP